MIILDRAMANLLATSAVFAMVSAQIDIPPTAAPEAPTCMNFSDMDFTLNGDAKWSTDCRLELTSENPELSGSAFSAITFDDTVNYPFEAYYEYDITDTVINGTSVGGIADGIAFLVHIDPQGVNALNNAGGALGVYGAGGIHCAIVIELDTYFGPTNFGPHAPFSTVDYTRALDIIATDEAGNATRYAEVNITDIFTMQGKVWVSHNNGILDVYLAPQTATTRPLRPLVSVEVPIPALMLNRDEIYVGFSSSTGGEYDKHEVVFCSFEEVDTPEPTTTPTKKPVDTPEPTTTPTKKPVDTPEPTTTPTIKPVSIPTPSPIPPVTTKPLPVPNPTFSPTSTILPKKTPSPTPIPAKPTFEPSTIPTIPLPPTSNIVPPKERCDDSKAGKGKAGKGKGGPQSGKGKGGTSVSSSSSGKGGSKGSSDCDSDSDSKDNADSKGKATGKSGKGGSDKSSKAQKMKKAALTKKTKKKIVPTLEKTAATKKKLMTKKKMMKKMTKKMMKKKKMKKKKAAATKKKTALKKTKKKKTAAAKKKKTAPKTWIRLDPPPRTGSGS